jgi:TolB protein
MKRRAWFLLVLALSVVPGGASSARPNARILLIVDGELISMRSDGSGRRVLTTNADAAKWSHSRSQVAVLRYGEDASETELSVMNAGGSGERVVARPAGSYDWSPDDSRIAFAKPVEGDEPLESGSSALAVVDLETGEERQVTESGYEPTWSPDGSRLAYLDSVCPEDPLSNGECNGDIYSVELDGGAITRLTSAEGEDQNPAWSPDGDKIAFSTTRHDRLGTEDGGAYTSEIYVMDADGSNETRVTHDRRVHDVSPTWSPDGRLIAYLHYFDDDVAERDGEIQVVRPDGSRRRPLTRNLRYETPPSWSPDGMRLIYLGVARTKDDVSYRDPEVFSVELTSRHERRLTANDLDESWVFWWEV